MPRRTAPGQAGAKHARVTAFALILIGVCISFPVIVYPPMAESTGPRLSDLANLVGALALVLALSQGKPLHRSIVMLATIWVLSFGWLVAEAYYSYAQVDAIMQRVLVRWLLAGFAVYWLALLMEHGQARFYVCMGLLAGTLLSASTVLYDYATFHPETVDPRELVNLAIYSGKDIADIEYRAFGIFGHPNGAAGCILIAIPILLGLVEEKRLPRSALWLAIALEAAVFYATKSRGSLAVSAGLLAYWVLFCTPPVYRIASAALLAVAGVLLLAWLSQLDFTDSVLLRRFVDTSDIDTNVAGRWWTVTSAFDLMLRHPFGMASSYGTPLSEATGTNATHNAYLELALLGGLPLACFVAVRLICTASLLASSYRPVEAWLAAYLAGIFLFETYFVQVNIPILTIWALWGSRRAVAPAKSDERASKRVESGWRLAYRHETE